MRNRGSLAAVKYFKDLSPRNAQEVFTENEMHRTQKLNGARSHMGQRLPTRTPQDWQAGMSLFPPGQHHEDPARAANWHAAVAAPSPLESRPLLPPSAALTAPSGSRSRR